MRTLVLRAVAVILAVLLCLILLRHFGIVSEESDMAISSQAESSNEES